MTSLAHPFYHHWHTFCFQIYIPLWLNPLPLLWFFAYMFLLSVVSSEFACSLTLWTQANLNVSISSDLPFIHSAGSLPLRVFCLWFPLCEESASCLLRPLGETDTGLSFLPVLRSILLACLTTSIFFLLASLQCECWTVLESGALLVKYVKVMTMTAAQHEVVTHFHYTPITSSTSVRVKRPQQSHFLLGPKQFLLVMKILEVEIWFGNWKLAPLPTICWWKSHI